MSYADIERSINEYGEKVGHLLCTCGENSITRCATLGEKRLTSHRRYGWWNIHHKVRFFLVSGPFLHRKLVLVTGASLAHCSALRLSIHHSQPFLACMEFSIDRSLSTAKYVVVKGVCITLWVSFFSLVRLKFVL
jgi:hypothetical protein